MLDVGCGTGRIVLDLLAQGIDTDGVDNSPEMLALCRGKARMAGLKPQLFEQTMETLELPRRYRTILVPSSSFQLLTERSAAEAALNRFWNLLKPGGALLMPFFWEWKPGDPPETEWGLVFEKMRPEDGAVVRRWSKERYSPEESLWHSEDRCEVSKAGKTIEEEHHSRSPAGRWYSQEEAVRLYQNAGFENVQVFSEFTRIPALPDDPLFCVLGIKPAPPQRK